MARNSNRIKLQYAGMTGSPDDYLSPDGELLTCIGLENQAGAKMSAMRHAPKEISRTSYYNEDEEYDENDEVIYVHEMANKKIAILARKLQGGDQVDRLLWVDVTDGWPACMESANKNTLVSVSEDICGVKSIGNTIIINGYVNMHYAVWKDGTYKYLGTRIPELPITFGLQTEYCHYWTNRGVKDDNSEDAEEEEESTVTETYFNFSRDYDYSNSDVDYHLKLKDADVTDCTTDVMAKVNHLIAEGTEKGYFMQSFLVRYALKLYDGSTTMASVPVYMPVCHPKNSIAMPFPLVERDKAAQDHMQRWYMDYIKAKLDYAANAAALSAMNDWSDVVKGITIAVSAPIYGYNPGGKLEMLIGGHVGGDSDPKACFFYNMGHDEVKTISKVIPTTRINDNYNLKDARDCYDRSDSADFYVHEYDEIGGDTAQPGYPYSYIQLPVKTQAEYDKEVKECSIFYIYKELKLAEIQTDRTVLKVKKGFLSTLVNQPTLDDEYNSHDKIKAGYMYTYNGRLNLCNITRTLWNGFDPQIFFPYQDRYLYGGDRKLKMFVTVTEGDKTNVISSDYVTVPTNITGYYLYYPNTTVDKIQFVKYNVNDDQYFKYTYEAEEHTGLNGSVVYNGNLLLNGDWDSMTEEDPSPTVTDGKVSCNNKLYTSNALNPWVFLPQNINTVGNGKIIGMAVAKKAISLGQAGAYPMYCMTEDGVWIMTPNETGGWASKQPIMTDVCTVADAIVETDGAVIMPTTRGLMLLQGEQSTCITDVNNKCNSIKPSDLPGLSNCVSATWGFSVENMDRDLFVDVAEYMQSSLLRGVYDYKNDRVLYYRSDRDYSVMIYTGGDNPEICLQKWNLLSAPGHVSGCPVMIEQGDYKYLADLSGVGETVVGTDSEPLTLSSKALIVTRPIKGTDQGLRDVRKQLDTIWHQGRYQRGSLDILLYGTQDYDKWYLIGQAKNATGLYGHHGQHWMAFILVVCAKNMQTKDAIDCVDLTMTARLVDKSAAIQGYK